MFSFAEKLLVCTLFPACCCESMELSSGFCGFRINRQFCAHSFVCVLCSANCPVDSTQVYWSTIFEVYLLWRAQYLPPVGPVHISSWGIFVRWVRQLNHLQFWRKKFEHCQLLKGGAFVFANRNPKTFTHVAEVEVGRQIFAHVITCGSFCIHPEITDCRNLRF